MDPPGRSNTGVNQTLSDGPPVDQNNILHRLNVVGQPQTNCSVTSRAIYSRPIQTGLCMSGCVWPPTKNDL